MHLSEDDLRTKVVYEWLKDCGLSSTEILIESSFSIRLGKTKKLIHPRTDILVRLKDGTNLLIIEVKKPQHNLNEKDAEQAISYARMLTNNIAPFTILTNGKDTKIFDSVTGLQINGTNIPRSHPYVIAGFVPNGDAIQARYHALEHLLSLSSENLLAFCEGQVAFRMKPLKGIDVFSGKKYIPQLYVEREFAAKDLKSKLFEEEKKRKLLLVVGQPQHGKTCFMCYTVEKFLNKGYPCLFFPAISLRKGLFASIQEDLEWSFKESQPSFQWINRLNRIGQKLGKRIFIFVDGWNEMATQALEINQECQRLNLEYISIIISTTIPSLGRLLNDESANPTYISEATNLTNPIIKYLSKELLKDTSQLGIIQINQFDNSIIHKVYEKYVKAYKILEMAYSKILLNPFYLRIACEQYAGSKVPENVSRIELIKNSLIKKGKRRNIKPLELFQKLGKLAAIFFDNGRPLSIQDISHCFENSKDFDRWKDSGIISTFYENEELVDFYFTHDLDYSIGILHQKWNTFFKNANSTEVLDKIQHCTKVEVRKSALRWFLSSPENGYLLRKIFHSIPIGTFANISASKIISEAIVKQVILNQTLEFQWLEYYLSKLIIIQKQDDFVIEELPGLLFSLVMSLDREKQNDKYRYWMRYLIKYDNSIEEISIKESFISKVYGENIRGYTGYEGSTALDLDLFKELFWDNDLIISQKAFFFYAYCCPDSFLENFNQIKNQLRSQEKSYQRILETACEHINYELLDRYYGNDYCKGWLLYREKGDKEVATEYYKMKNLISSIIRIYPRTKSKFADSLYATLMDLRRIGNVSEEISIDYENPKQLKLAL